MKHARRYRYTLRLDPADKRSLDAVARETGRTINQVQVTSVRKGLPLAREALGREGRRITNVDPLPGAIWRRLYSRKDEVDGCSGDLRAVQSQREPD